MTAELGTVEPAEPAAAAAAGGCIDGSAAVIGMVAGTMVLIMMPGMAR